MPTIEGGKIEKLFEQTAYGQETEKNRNHALNVPIAIGRIGEIAMVTEKQAGSG
jgi:hypothetical protein